MAGGGSKPGERRGGREKGTPNHITKCVKAAIVEALNAGDGAVAFFEKLKTDDPKTFATVCGRLIPHEVTGPGGKDILPTPACLDPQHPDHRLEVVRRACFILELANRAVEG